MVDQGGTCTWSAQTTTYGQVRLTEGTRLDCPFRFQGQYEDVETGLYYNRFRYYDPQAGTYVSQDPIRLRGGLKQYSYVANTNSSCDAIGLSGSPLFRGTTLGYPGNPTLERIQITPTTTDPRIATIFATESSRYGQGVVHVATPKELAGVTRLEGNVLSHIEKEVPVNIAPSEFAKRANTLPVEKAREILKGMGHEISRNIGKADLSELVRNLPPISEAEIGSFINQASDYFMCKN